MYGKFLRPKGPVEPAGPVMDNTDLQYIVRLKSTVCTIYSNCTILYIVLWYYDKT